MLALFEALPALAALESMKRCMEDVEEELAECHSELDYLSAECIMPEDAEELEEQIEVLEELQRWLDEGKPAHLTSKEWLGLLREAYQHLQALED